MEFNQFGHPSQSDDSYFVDDTVVWDPVRGFISVDEEDVEADLGYLRTTSSTLIAVMTVNDSRDHTIIVAVTQEEKRDLLLRVSYNDPENMTSVVMHHDGLTRFVNDRKEALEWLGYVPHKPTFHLVAADGVEYMKETELANA